MKFIHLSDLHLGKRLNGYSMIEDQRYIMEQILSIVQTESPDAVVIAGDVYDKSMPSIEAVELFDELLSALAKTVEHTFIISGNHDSPERLSVGAALFNQSGIHISRAYSGKVEPFTLTDSYGPVMFYMLPFVKPAHVRRYWPEDPTDTYTDAVATAIQHMETDPSCRNILITHQFVTGAFRCDSEEISVGGTDHVDVSVFDGFSYVALGHIHSPQPVTRSSVRYCGTPLKYSFSEAGQSKSVTIVELGALPDDISIRTVPLHPMRDLRELKGQYEEITRKEAYQNTCTDDYIHITLTDEQDIPYAMDKLRVIYPNLLRLDYDNTRTRSEGSVFLDETADQKTPLELFSDLFRQQNGRDMSEEQRQLTTELMESIWRDDR